MPPISELYNCRFAHCLEGTQQVWSQPHHSHRFHSAHSAVLLAVFAVVVGVANSVEGWAGTETYGAAGLRSDKSINARKVNDSGALL